MSKLPDNFVRARTALLLTTKKGSFWARLALAMAPVELSKEEMPMGTTGTDGDKLFFNREFLEGRTQEECQFLTVHEAAHCAFNHPWRRGSRNPELFNIANDVAIHLHMEKDTWKIPQWATGQPDHRFLQPGGEPMRSEEIYDILYRELMQNGETKIGDNTIKRVDGGEGLGRPGNHKGCGMKDGTANGQVEAQQRVRAAIRAARQRGNIPAGLEHLIEELSQPIINWRHKLQRFFNVLVRDEYSWSRFNRRVLHNGMYFPSMWTEKLNHVALIRDTSGSCLDEQGIFLSEIVPIWKRLRPKRITLIDSDCVVNRKLILGPDDPIDQAKKFLGGGGTSFVPAFDELMKGPLPQVAIYLTDMYGVYPSYIPPFPVLWCSTTREGWTPPPFGEVLYIDPHQ